MSPIPHDTLTQAVYLYKLRFAAAANAHQGTTQYASQHSVLWGLLHEHDGSPSDAGAQPIGVQYSDGVCAGLAIEWIIARCTGGNLVKELLAARTLATSTGPETRAPGRSGTVPPPPGAPSGAPATAIQIEPIEPTAAAPSALQQFATRVLASHYRQKDVASALVAVCTPDGATDSIDYPFTSLAKAIRKQRFHYLSSGTHAMAAWRGADGKVDFYDPNVGEILGTTPAMLGAYLKQCKDVSAFVSAQPARPEAPERRPSLMKRASNAPVLEPAEQRVAFTAQVPHTLADMAAARQRAVLRKPAPGMLTVQRFTRDD